LDVKITAIDVYVFLVPEPSCGGYRMSKIPNLTSFRSDCRRFSDRTRKTAWICQSIRDWWRIFTGFQKI